MVEHVNSEEPQRTASKYTWGSCACPDEIEKMMNNGVRFSQTKDSWALENDNISLKKLYSVYFTVESHAQISILLTLSIVSSFLVMICFQFNNNWHRIRGLFLSVRLRRKIK